MTDKDYHDWTIDYLERNILCCEHTIAVKEGEIRELHKSRQAYVDALDNFNSFFADYEKSKKKVNKCQKKKTK